MTPVPTSDSTHVETLIKVAIVIHAWRESIDSYFDQQELTIWILAFMMVLP